MGRNIATINNSTDYLQTLLHPPVQQTLPPLSSVNFFGSGYVGNKQNSTFYSPSQTGNYNIGLPSIYNISLSRDRESVQRSGNSSAGSYASSISGAFLFVNWLDRTLYKFMIVFSTIGGDEGIPIIRTKAKLVRQESNNIEATFQRKIKQAEIQKKITQSNMINKTRLKVLQVRQQMLEEVFNETDYINLWMIKNINVELDKENNLPDDCAGGVILTSHFGRIRINNTLEERLTLAQEEVKHY
ncbi:unnamed protein product [Rhizophagus irregularis]|nr:unnamed protein product [Rhizophagus irregularis]